MKISVIIPTFNSAITIIRAIKSVLFQTIEVTEIIICDDGSTDETYNLVKGLNNIKIQWLNCGRNKMPAIPRNMGIKHAKGDFIAFLDSDDHWAPEKLERQLKIMQSMDSLIVSSNAIRITEKEFISPYFNLNYCPSSFRDLINQNFVITSTVLVNRELLFKSGLFPENKNLIVGEDYALWLRISSLTRWAYDMTPLIYYNDNPNQSIRRFSQSENLILLRVYINYLLWSRFSNLLLILRIFVKKILVNLFKL